MNIASRIGGDEFAEVVVDVEVFVTKEVGEQPG